MRMLSIETTTHGRVLVRDATAPVSAGLIVAFHGYGQSAEDMLAEIERLPGSDEWTIASVQALHRFYTRGNERVAASWMTRQDRDQAISDNVAYVDRVVDALGVQVRVFLGFSQGAAMAYRAAVLGKYRAAAIIGIGGDIPPELKTVESAAWPRAYVAAGEADSWYTPAKVNADIAFLQSRSANVEYLRYRGGHEWTDELRKVLGRWLTEARLARS